MTTTHERKLKEFEAWVVAEGLIKPRGLTIAKTEEGGYGLVFESAEKLKEYQKENKSLLELSVPFNLIFCTILHPEKAQPLRDKIVTRYPDFFAHDKEQGKHLVADNDSDLLLDSEQIASYMFLIQQNRDPNSYWRKYLDLLPKTFTSVLHWSEEELALVKGSNLYDLTLQSRKLVEYMYLNMKEIDPALTREEIKWAHSLFSSRAFGVRTGQVIAQNTNLQFYYRDEDPPSVSCLVPFCDFFNHDFNTRAYYSAEREAEQFNFQILYEPEKTGLQVMNNYGKKSNEHLIVNYGFMIEGNLNNTFWLKIGVSKKDPMVGKKFSLLRKKRLSGKYVIKKGEIPEKLMEAARLYLMTPAQYYFYNKKHYERAETPMHSPREPLLPAVDDIATDHMNEHRVFSRSTNKEFKFITVENELQMYAYLIRQFQTHLDKLKALETVPVPTSGHPYHIKMALTYRAEQIDILESTLSTIKELRKEFIQIVGDQPYFYPFESAFLAASVKQEADDWNNSFSSENEGEIVSVPLDSLICRATISKTNVGKDILSRWPSIPDDALICLFLIRIRYDDSNTADRDTKQWSAFFNLLRTVEYHTAINFNDQEVDSLEGTPAHDQIVTMRNELLEESQTYEEPFDRWLWAQSTLRLFGELAQLNPDNADDSTLVLFPTVNQLRPNAAHPVRITVDFATQRIAVVATVPGMASSNFGGLDNTWLLIQFGLIFDDNIQDELEFELTIAPDHDLREEKLKLLDRYKLSLSHRLNRCTMSLQLLAAIKICAMSREEVTLWLNKTQDFTDKTLIEYDDMFVSSENERMALEALQFMLNRMLESYETSIEDDAENLNRSELSVRERLILRYKMSQKKIIKANIRIVDNLVAQL